MLNHYLRYSIIVIITALMLSICSISATKSIYAQNSDSTDWMSICNAPQSALIPSCSDLVNSDNTLTQQGQDAVKCIKSGALIGGRATLLGVPLGIVTRGLSLLAAPTGCGGIVDMKALQNIAGLNSILNMLP